MRAYLKSAPLLLLALAGCGTQIVPPATGFTPATTRPVAGKALLGQNARTLIAQFGEPRLDIRDPAVRKLQFGNAYCVMDVYLYPPGANREPLANYADARLVTTGAALPWQDCVKALEQR